MLSGFPLLEFKRTRDHGVRWEKRDKIVMDQQIFCSALFEGSDLRVGPRHDGLLLRIATSNVGVAKGYEG